ncbi:MAG TPA: EamA family transporter [Pyrinomonadaceae bacterium]
MRLKANLAADAALVLTTLIWGSTFVIAKDILSHWPPVAYITVRFALAALVLVAIFPKQLLAARRAEWQAGATLGFLMGSGFAIQAVGQVYTTPANSAFITSLTTPLVPLVALIVLRVRPNLENLIGVSLATMGGLLILAPRGAFIANQGDLCTLVATFFFASHMTLLSVYARRMDARQLTVLQISVAAAMFVSGWLLLHLIGHLFSTQSLPQVLEIEAGWPVWSATVAWQLVYLALIATVVTFLLWTWGQARMSATHAAIIFSLEPVFATAFALAWWGSGQWLGGWSTVGAASVIAGVIVSELRLSNRRDKSGREPQSDDADISLDEQLPGDAL